ncbi:AfsR/SARP family transcriptional regulator [Amycolatopsis keratiniphila]|uniref:SARP family transcriptional regulator n=1 Tax=Amycolatopsis keratiniphila TaxID=129921 RepID=R4TAU5_9PSEU|nr:BTAD domain-containing putative transcriptional regulator [Amycolatopsis keratiniphila]AGM07937.1 SARP family transcriptional regulator [Amycolatopsis keratiniphila]
MGEGLNFRILGPLEVVVGGVAVPVNASKQRVLLARLLLAPNKMVSADELVDLLWDQGPPRGARATLQTYVQRLRRVIGDPGRIATLTGGYRISVEPGELDLARFRELSELARHALDFEDKARILRDGLACWRGEALADVSSDSLRTIYLPRLEQERLMALELLFDAELRLGRHRELIPELHAATHAAPLREKLHSQLMLAMYRSGQQAEAFAVYHRIRESLADELGVDPDAELQTLYRRLLARSSAVGPSTADAAPESDADDSAPHELPADVPDFVGRELFASQIKKALGKSTTGVPVVVITGLPGVGKTALAVKVAHEMHDQFPDGQLYVDLRGHASMPALTPTDVLARFLTSLGAKAAQLPANREELVGLYRTFLRGRKVLVLLDNAGNPGQVRPLLPSAPGCAVVVTSRNDLRGLVALQSAELFQLGVLTDEQSLELLVNIVGAERVRREQAAAMELASLCGWLPLALRIAAANVVTQPGRSLADYVAGFRQGNRLTSLEIDGDEEATVRTAFQHSYAALEDATAEAFRLLGLIWGTDFSVAAVGALLGVTDVRAEALLDQLTVANLVMRGAGGRYQLHDLLRMFAEERCAEEPVVAAEAAERLLTFYFRHTEAAAEILYPTYVRQPRPEFLAAKIEQGFADSSEAVAWMNVECVNVLAAVVGALESDFNRLAWLLVETLRPYLVASGRNREEGLAVFAAALRAAIAEDDLSAIAAIHCCLGSLNFRHGELKASLHHFSQEHLAYRAARHVEGQAHALVALGATQREAGRIDDGASLIYEGLELAEQTENVPLQRFGWLCLSYAELLRGNLNDAEKAARRTIELCDPAGEQASEGDVRGILGEILLLRGHCGAAIEQFTRSLELLRNGSVGHFEADVLGHLSHAYRECGNLEAAGQNARLALRISRDSAAKDDEAEALIALAALRQMNGDLDEAHRLYRAALSLCQEIGYTRGEVSALVGHADISRVTGNAMLAVSQARRAIALCEGAGLKILGMRARVTLAHAELDGGNFESAAVQAGSAFAAAQGFGAQLDQARALHVLALSRRAGGDPAAAERYWRMADECLEETAIPDSSGIRRSLADVRCR